VHHHPQTARRTLIVFCDAPRAADFRGQESYVSTRGSCLSFTHSCHRSLCFFSAFHVVTNVVYSFILFVIVCLCFLSEVHRADLVQSNAVWALHHPTCVLVHRITSISFMHPPLGYRCDNVVSLLCVQLATFSSTRSCGNATTVVAGQTSAWPCLIS